jgi:hypothetical protein
MAGLYYTIDALGQWRSWWNWFFHLGGEVLWCGLQTYFLFLLDWFDNLCRWILAGLNSAPTAQEPFFISS